MTITLESTASIKLQPHCIVYGPAKSGKTRLIKTLSKPVICNTDFGLGVINDVQLPKHDCKKWDDVVKFMDWVRKGGAKEFSEIVFDDLTEMCQLYLDKAFRATSNAGNKAHGQQVYGAMADEILAFIREVRHFDNCTVVLLCKESRIQDENKRFVYAPMVPGRAVNPLLAYLVGQIYRMDTLVHEGKTHECLRCKRTETYEAGDRSGKLHPTEQAHLGNIIAKVRS